MIYPIRKIVVGIASLDADDPILVGAIDIAERTGAEIHLVHAFVLPSLVWDAYARMGYVEMPAIETYADTLRARLQRAVAEHSTTVRVGYHAIAAPPATAIRDMAEELRADLVIVGATRHGNVSRVLLGTTAQRVVRQANAPVIVLRKWLGRPIRKVLLTTELGPFCAGVHELGLDVIDTLAGDAKPELRSLLVVGPVLHLPPPLPEEQIAEFAHDQLAKFLLRRRNRGRPIEGVVRIGEPSVQIVKEAEEARPDLIVVGTHSRTGVNRWLMGSVAEATIRETGANVLVIPAGVEEQRQLPVPRESHAAMVPSDPTPFEPVA
jgi:nucleotide-binding universal stress UspA family protein